MQGKLENIFVGFRKIDILRFPDLNTFQYCFEDSCSSKGKHEITYLMNKSKSALSAFQPHM